MSKMIHKLVIKEKETQYHGPLYVLVYVMYIDQRLDLVISHHHLYAVCTMFVGLIIVINLLIFLSFKDATFSSFRVKKI